MIDSHISLYVVLTAAGLAFVQRYWAGGRRPKLRHPPSPKSLPLVGNLFPIPPGLDSLAYIELGKRLNSDIIYLDMIGQPVIVLNSAQAAVDLLEKRSAIYSDRLCAPMLKNPKLLDWSGFIGMLPYGDLWRRQRRRMNNWLNLRAVVQFSGLQQDSIRHLLARLMDISPSSPHHFERVKHQFFFAMGSATFKLAYGYRHTSDQDPFLLNAVEATDNVFSATVMSNFLVNAFPVLSYVPSWFPGAGWKHTAQKWREQKNHAVDAPYEWTQRQVATEEFEPSVLGALLQGHKLASGLSTEDRDKELKELAYMLFAGGTETSATALVAFVAAMVTNPEAQDKAQAEIDSVLGYATRLPVASDEAHLPYVRNLILEVSRWQPVSPTGGPPHVSYQDDVYRGYDIQKGTMLIGNLWAMSRDETVYKNPDSFEPDRFLDPTVPHLPAFGWGRRKCPGIHFAEASLFIGISSMLTTFTFSRKKDKDGKEIIPIIEGASNSLTVMLKPFDFEVQPRSEKHRQLIIESIPKE
ncbi:O-methylsterigmatocystin oxidoreductase [Rhizoctonia solani]|uniref:O-methylsterigmatocystin oxidoreductase n=1 Tax=Rhizoctonia solani TaxID=456999 RepID=A0A0K6G2H3_9AGAM|nr:O-methylsterigmatocystin oxidoreductase [Rhizoctonia solani]